MGRYGIYWLCVLIGCVLFFPTQVVAKEVHLYRSSFGSEGSALGQFKEPTGVAVNYATHHVYVADSRNERVEIFDSLGVTSLGEFAPASAFSEPTEVLVDNSGSPLDPSSEDVYVVDRGQGVIDKFDSSGVYLGVLNGNKTPGGQFETGETEPRSIEGVAVDQSGVVWVHLGSGMILAFSNGMENEFIAPERVTPFGSGFLEGLAVDPEDSLYFKIAGHKFVKVDSSGKVLLQPFSEDEKAFRSATDSVNGEIYLDNLDSIEAFSFNGAKIEEFGSGHLTFSKAVAVDSSNGMIYTTDQVTDNVSIFEGVLLPSVTTGNVSEQQPRSVTLNGTVNPEGLPVTECLFEYGETSAYGLSVPCSPNNPGGGTSPVPVSAHLEGLTPGKIYHYRLVAKNAAGVPSVTVDHEVFAGPLLDEFTSDVTSSSVTLNGPVDPNGGDTQYYFEYGLSTAYGSYAPAPPPGVDIGATVGIQSLSVHLQGLEPNTLYHYRILVVQGGEVFEGTDRSFETQGVGGSSVLSDGRSWELVSPPNKKGALIGFSEAGGQVQAASDGSGIAYVTSGSHIGENAVGHIEISPVLSKREHNGDWVSLDLTLPGGFPKDGEPAEVIGLPHFEYHLFSPDLSLAAVEPQQAGTPLLSPEATERTLYLRDNIDSSFLPLVTSSNVPSGTKIEEPVFGAAGFAEWQMHFLAATPDLKHIVLKTPKALTPEAFDEEDVNNYVSGQVQWNLYEWGDGVLRLVNILPNGDVAHGPASVYGGVRLAGMANAGGLGRGTVQRVVSSDGRRVAWTWGEPYSSVVLEKYRGLFVRDTVEGKTVQIGGPSASFQTMSSDGSKIFFLENGDLYLYDYDSGVQTDLTGSYGVGESSAGVQELVSNVSEDGSYVYFVATGVLAAGGEGGKNNLYVLHDTNNVWNITHIATLSAEDKPSWYSQLFVAPFLAHISSRVSPNGRFMAFMSDRSLTGYDNIDAVSGQPDEEVFEYDAVLGRLVCGSCNPTGARPVGVFDSHEAELLVDRQEVWTAKESGSSSDKHFNHWLDGSVPGWDNLDNNPATYQPRYLSDSGRLIFNSPDSLTTQDTNGLEDVYEYEPVGVGSCVTGGVGFSGDSQGCVSLISSGTASEESVFYDASEDGDDVFFITSGKLVGKDYDKGYDVYDAHVCSSVVPCQQEVVPSPACSSGDSCKAAPALQPEIFGPAPTATFNGVGNVSVAGHVVKPKRLTLAEKRAIALRACLKKKGKRRTSCQRRARKRYPAKRPRSSAVNGKGGR